MVKKVCTKTIFANEEAAKAVIEQIAKKNQDRKRPTRAYKCPDCGHWHLTSLPDIDKLLQENANLHRQVDDLKQQVQLLIQEKTISKEEGKDLKRSIKKEDMYKQLLSQQEAARKANKQLEKDKAVLLQSVVNLQNEIERLKAAGNRAAE